MIFTHDYFEDTYSPHISSLRQDQGRSIAYRHGTRGKQRPGYQWLLPEQSLYDPIVILIHVSNTRRILRTWHNLPLPPLELSAFDKAIYHQLLNNKISEEFAQDLWEQEAIFEEQRDALRQHIGKTVVICGGEVFIGEDLGDALKKAREKFLDRPFFTASIGTEHPSGY